MLVDMHDELLALAQRLYQLGHRRQWVIGDEVWYARKRQPGLYHIEYIFHSRNTGSLFMRSDDKTLRVSIDDDRLLHLPLPEDVLSWFQKQQWIDFYTLRTETDATHEFIFYYHRRASFRRFHHADERVVSLQALVAGYELIAEIIAE